MNGMLADASQAVDR